MRNPNNITVTKIQAERMTRAVDEQLRLMDTSWAQLGKMIDVCLKKNVPAALGLNAQQWMEKRMPFSTTKGWRALRITRALSGIPQKKVKQLTEGNAVQLTRLPERQRKSKVWVNRAIDTPTEKFREDVATHLAVKQGIEREEMVSLRMSMPRSIFDEWEKAILKVSKILSLDVEMMPGRRIQVYEGIAALINGTDEKRLETEMVGDEERES